MSQTASEALRYRSARGRWVLAATVLGTGVAFLDATVVNIALPAIGAELEAELEGLQWTVNGYALTLAAFILFGGSLGDRFGRKRVFLIGVAWFAVASLWCGVAPSIELLVAARALQGVGGALLTPGALAILQSSFHPDDRGRAIGAWSGLGGIAGAIGPLLGGWLVGQWSWRWVFLINLPLAAAVLWIGARYIPESSDPRAPRELDLAGVGLGALGLAGTSYGLTAAADRALLDPIVLGALAVGIAALVAFVLVERSSKHPMMPLELFRSRQFSATNVVTLCVYAALAGVFFLLVITLQIVAGYTPLRAGLAMLPVTILMLALSARAGDLGQRIGPRIPMTAGPIVCALALLWLARLPADAQYLVDVLPAMIVFGLGLSLTVAPLTTTVLASADDRFAGIASGINNAVARAAGLLAIAGLPLLSGLRGASYEDPAALAAAFRTSMLLCAALLTAGGLLAFATIRRPAPTALAPSRTSCPVGAPPLSAP